MHRPNLIKTRHFRDWDLSPSSGEA